MGFGRTFTISAALLSVSLGILYQNAPILHISKFGGVVEGVNNRECVKIPGLYGVSHWLTKL